LVFDTNGASAFADAAVDVSFTGTCSSGRMFEQVPSTAMNPIALFCEMHPLGIPPAEVTKICEPGDGQCTFEKEKRPCESVVVEKSRLEPVLLVSSPAAIRLTVALAMGFWLPVTVPETDDDDEGGVPVALPFRATTTDAAPLPALLLMGKVPLYRPSEVG